MMARQLLGRQRQNCCCMGSFRCLKCLLNRQFLRTWFMKICEYVGTCWYFFSLYNVIYMYPLYIDIDVAFFSHILFHNLYILMHFHIQFALQQFHRGRMVHLACRWKPPGIHSSHVGLCDVKTDLGLCSPVMRHHWKIVSRCFYDRLVIDRRV